MTLRATTGDGISPTIPARQRNEVLSVSGFGAKERANIAFDPGTIANIERGAERYIGHQPGGRRPPNFKFFEAQPEIVMTTVEDLWVSHNEIPREREEIAWEVWLQPTSEPRFREVLEILDLKARPSIRLQDVRVLSVDATREHFDRLARSAAIAQLRPASTLNAPLIQAPAGVQQANVLATAGRIVAATNDAPAVCLLDTGIEPAHPLLSASIDTIDTVAGGTGADWDGHGTQMAGVALFEDLAGDLAGRHNIRLPIRIDSVEMEGAAGSARLPAERLRRAVDLVEQARDRPRTYCLAMNAPDEAIDGGASSMSSELDTLAYEVDAPRLFCVAAGNLEGMPAQGNYQALNETTGMMTPSQAWNALSIAASTDLVDVPGTHDPVAPAGDLSPWSRTSVNWERNYRPPSKPDVVFEGGNQMIDRASLAIGNHPSLCVVTTANDMAAPLTLTAQTSAATAAVAGLCARLQAQYPALWPESIRGLVAHSCEHTPAMETRANACVRPRVTRQQALLERFGYGRADRARAMENAEDALTLINQASLRPLRLNDNGDNAILGQMRVHRLPWPSEVLQSLGRIEAELRVTLSYFIEPNPGEAVKGDVDQYPSHHFDFDIQQPGETEDEAIARHNGLFAAAANWKTQPTDWLFGRYRGRGSLKHDRISMPAEDLARVGGVLVVPRKGWWGRNIDLVDQQARYSLIVSIRTPGAEIYTEIATAIGVEVET